MIGPMATESAVHLLEAAFAEIAGSPPAMKRLARAASTRDILEREWVYEIDSTDALASAQVAREVPMMGGRADLSVDGTLVEFKSTKPWYAVERFFQDSSPVRRDSAERRFSGDMTRMEANDGVFVLIVSSAGRVLNDEFGTMPSREHMREEGMRRYTQWLHHRAGQLRAGAVVSEVFAGEGTYAEQPARHDALIIWWPAMALGT